MDRDIRELALLKFREELFLKELEQYRRNLTGEYESILPYVRDEKGRYSEEKTCAVVGELSENIRIIRAYVGEMTRKKLREEGKSEEDVMGYEYDGAYSGAQEGFVRDFLYCALRISELDELSDPGGFDISGATQTFHDLLWYSEDHYEKQERLYAGEAMSEAVRNDYGELKGIYRPASWLVHMLTGQELSALYPEELQKKYAHCLPDAIRTGVREMNCAPSEYFWNVWPEEACRTQRRREQEASEWIRKRFDEPDKFVKSYLSFREKRYDPAYIGDAADTYEQILAGDNWDLMNMAYGLGEYVKYAVLMFTEKRGLSHFQNDNIYFAASAGLRRAEKNLKKLAKEDRGAKP